MSEEMMLGKELSSVTASVLELIAVKELVDSEMDGEDFQSSFRSMLADIAEGYQAIVDALGPLVSLTETETQDFETQFAEAEVKFLATFSKHITLARQNAEAAYAKYEVFSIRKDVGTGYPPLRYAFGRLREYARKWIDNDVAIGMSADIVLKLLAAALRELRKSNMTEYPILRSLMLPLQPQLQLIARGASELRGLPGEDAGSGSAA